MDSQNLPNYIHLFENDHRWIKYESEHYIFHYFPSSVAESEIETIVRVQEDSFKKIISVLNVPTPSRKINYYLYPDRETKTALMGDDWYAQAIRKEYCVHVLYTKDIKPIGPHEDTHLLSLSWGISIGFFQEGLAEYMVGHAWDGKPHAIYVKEGYRNNLYLPLSEYFVHEAWLNTDDSKPLYFYSLVGSFTTFLIDKFGIDKYKNLYMTTNRLATKEHNISVFEKIYETTLVNIEKDFKNFINN